MSFVVAGLLLIAALIRAGELWQPLGGHLREADREIVTAAQARILHHAGWAAPLGAVPWQEAAPARQGLPVHAWLLARLYDVFGEHDVVMRAFSFVAALLGLYVFWRLAVHVLPRAAAEAALLFMTFSPLSVRLASTVQPEGLTLLFYLTALLAFLRWLERGKSRCFWVAMASSSLAVLTDLVALHLLLIFLGLAGGRAGWRGWPGTRMLALLGLPAALVAIWYAMIATGHGVMDSAMAQSVSEAPNVSGAANSGGVASWLRGVPSIALVELVAIWMPAGAALAWFGRRLYAGQPRFRVLVWWLLAAALGYLFALPRSATLAGVGVHVYSLPLAALCVGLGFAAAVKALPAVFATPQGAQRGHLAITLFAITLVTQVVLIYLDAHPRQYAVLRADAGAFAAALPPDGRLAAVGGPRRDPLGLALRDRPVYFFYWLNRDGVLLDGGNLDTERVAALGRQGIDYLIAEHRWLSEDRERERWLRSRFPVLKEGAKSVLFGLRDAR